MSARERGEPSRLMIAAAFAAIYVIWGSTYLAIRFAIETIPPLLMAGARHTIGGIILYALVRRGIGLAQAPRPTSAHWRSAAIIGVLLLFVGNGGVCWAEQTVPSGLAALFVTTVPMWLVLLSWLRRDGVRPGLADGVGVAMGFLGVSVLVAGNGLFGGETVNPIGAGVLVLASLAWAGGSIYSRHASLPRSPLLATAMEMLCGGAVLIVVGLLTGEGARVVWNAITWRSLLSLLYLTVFGSLVAFSAYVWLLRVTTPSRVGTYAFVNPVVAVLLGYAFAGESLTARTLVATVVIVTAVVLITLYGRRVPPPERATAAGNAVRQSPVVLEERVASLGEAGAADYRLKQLIREHGRTNRPYYEFLRRESLSAGLYTIPAGGLDRQQPHLEDELYYVLEGRAAFRADGRTTEVGPGAVLFVPAGTEHRFEQVTETLRVLVVFAPPETVCRSADTSASTVECGC